MAAHKKRLFIICIAIFIITCSILLYLFVLSDYARQKRSDLKQLSSQEYAGVFCSMYPITNFNQEDFTTYRGLNTLKAENTLRCTSDVGKYLATAFDSGNAIENIYLGLDPAGIWNSCFRRESIWTRWLSEDILIYTTAHPDVTFEILLPAPSLEYWLEKSAETTEEYLNAYSSLVCTLAPQNNITIYFMGGEEWLIANPDNYCAPLTTNEMISRKLMLFTFCDHEYQINVENASAQLNVLKELIMRERTTPSEYPDLSSWDIVFFGDSIIGNTTGSFSVPGIVTGLSQAQTYNCAKSGISAASAPDMELSLLSSVDLFLRQDVTSVPDDCPFRDSLADYAATDHSSRNLCFVLNFGLNDYFCGYPISNPQNLWDDTTYAGALRSAIDRLQSNYPDASILVMTPNLTVLYDNGTQPLSEKGGVLTEYVDAALQVAAEMNVMCLDNYNDSGINADNAWTYLSDGTHLNETGRFLLAQRIMYALSPKE